MADNSQNMSNNAAEVQGQAQEKASSMMDKDSNTAQSAKDSMNEAGGQMKAKAQSAGDAVKNAIAMNR